MFRQFRCQGGHLGFPIDPENKILEEDVKTLLPVNFRWILLCPACRKVVNNILANQRPGWPSWFPDRPEKRKLGRRRCWILFGSFWGEVKNVSANQRSRVVILAFRRSENTNFVVDVEYTCYLISFIEFCLAISEKSKMWKVTGRQCAWAFVPDTLKSDIPLKRHHQYHLEISCWATWLGHKLVWSMTLGQLPDNTIRLDSFTSEMKYQSVLCCFLWPTQIR